MNLQYILILIASLAFAYGTSGCILNGETGQYLYTQPINESQAIGVVMWTGISDEEIFDVEFNSTRIQFLQGPNTLLMAVTNTFSSYIDSVRINPMSVELVVHCTSGSSRNYTLQVEIIDANTKSPRVEQPDYLPYMKILLLPDRDSSIPINLDYPLKISDQDFDLQNALVKCQASDPAVRIELELIEDWKPDAHYWNVLFYLDDESNPTLDVNLTCSDGVNDAVEVPGMLIIIDHYAPQFNRPYYTGVHRAYENARPGDRVTLDFVIAATDLDDTDATLNFTLSDDTLAIFPGERYMEFTKVWPTEIPLALELEVSDQAGRTASVLLFVIGEYGWGPTEEPVTCRTNEPSEPTTANYI